MTEFWCLFKQKHGLGYQNEQTIWWNALWWQVYGTRRKLIAGLNLSRKEEKGKVPWGKERNWLPQSSKVAYEMLPYI